MEAIQTAYFAGGCFWCMEYAFDHLVGVISTQSGYGGGTTDNPTYKDHGDHREMIKIEYDGNSVKYQDILDIYWKNIDPTDPDGQFFDRGFSYTTVIFYQSTEEKEIAELSKKELEESNKFVKPIVTMILPYKNFYLAEDYHQEYYKKNPNRYNSYKIGSGRDSFKKEHWNHE